MIKKGGLTDEEVVVRHKDPRDRGRLLLYLRAERITHVAERSSRGVQHKHHLREE